MKLDLSDWMRENWKHLSFVSFLAEGWKAVLDNTSEDGQELPGAFGREQNPGAHQEKELSFQFGVS